VRLSALRAGRPLPPGSFFLVLISFSGYVDPRAIVRLEGLGLLKNPMTSSGIEPSSTVPQTITVLRTPKKVRFDKIVPGLNELSITQ
jgi:hypothetical protein